MWKLSLCVCEQPSRFWLQKSYRLILFFKKYVDIEHAWKFHTITCRTTTVAQMVAPHPPSSLVLITSKLQVIRITFGFTPMETE